MLVLGFMLIGLGIFIVCLTVIDGVREEKENNRGFKDFIIRVLVRIVDIISSGLWGFRLFFIFIGLACIVFGVTILTVELY
ncbi:hypothetical protein ACT1UG_22595 [Bacillus paramycoides]|uniref:hypothetical protein n=1 Tax=Bacillus TaxID=1386 RepID=UPI00065476B1|nr:hypothetical protein [Bacillus sp. LK2]KMN42059.1 hypothetical protein VK90_26125 [Bacillus sp. LK2]